MPMNGAGTASKPANTTAISGQVIESAKFNSVIDDIYQILNTARPVAYGGTGAATAADARTNLGLVIGTNVQASSAALTALSTAFTPASAAGPASLALAEDTDSGSNKVTLQATAALGADRTVTFPDKSGTVAMTSDLETIDLGGTTDTTLSRAAAGVLAVEGNPVPSPASQATGDILYRGASAWARLAKGTDSQILTLASGLPAWADPAAPGQPIPTSSTYAVGTFMALKVNSGTVANGATIAGSGLRVPGWVNTAGVGSGATPTGTWQNVSGSTLDAAGQSTSYFVRTA